MNKKVIVPLLAPDVKLLRADAVWVTIANWAEGLENYYGAAEIIAGHNSYSAEQIRSRCFNNEKEKKSKPKLNNFRQSYLARLGETLLKDLRWFSEEKRTTSFEIEKFRAAPFVWQHHDLFQTRGLRLANQLGIPSVLFVDAPYVWESSKWGAPRTGWEWFSKKRGDLLPFKKADLVLVVSEDVKQAVLDLGVDERKVLVTPCTVSPDRFDRIKGEKVRSTLGLHDNFVIGWVGSFRKFHDLDLLIDAFRKISAFSERYKLLLIGDGPERIRLQEKIASYGLENRVIFPGNIPHNKVADYISSLDVAVLPSYSNEGFHYSPLKLREFFAAGVPVIASAVGEVKQIIEISKGGWLVPPGCIDSIAEMIMKCESDQTLLDSLGANARNYAVAEMGILKQIRMIEDYFDLIP